MTLTPEQQAELAEQGSQPERLTKRPTVQAIEAVLGNVYPVLDHGFVRVIDYMGDDAAVVQAARTSYGLGTKKVSSDKGLIHYLLSHWHTTPFEMCEIKLHCKLPIFVARQWIRHRTANVNEMSARYSILPNEFYIPERENLAPQSKTNRQGRSAEILNEDEAVAVRAAIQGVSIENYNLYLALLAEEGNKPEDMELDYDLNKDTFPGIAREIARIPLSLNFYTEWYWKTDLWNLMNFLRLRYDAHAQYEIRVYAAVIWDLVKLWVPLCAEVFDDVVLQGVRFTGKQMEIIAQMLSEVATSAGQPATVSLEGQQTFEYWHARNGISRRDWDAMCSTIKAKFPVPLIPDKAS